MRKITLPNVLAIAGALAIVVSLLYPWWSLDIEIIGKTYVYPYIIRGPATEVLGYRRTAQMPLLTGALIACIVLALAGSVLGKRAGRIALFGAGFLAAGGAWRFYERALDIASRYNMTSVNGQTVARMMSFSPLHVAASLQPGFYLNLAGAALCLLAAFFHTKLHPSPLRTSETKGEA
jgi:hypothetical protein